MNKPVTDSARAWRVFLVAIPASAVLMGVLTVSLSIYIGAARAPVAETQPLTRSSWMQDE